MKSSFPLAVLVLLSACAHMKESDKQTSVPGPTPYQPETDGFGYKDAELSKGRFMVQFRGNRHTDKFDAIKYARQRAEEVCKENEFKGMDVQSSEDASTQHQTPKGMYCPAPNMPCFEGGGRHYTRPAVILTVKCKG